jgi:hypothetical protein
VISAGGNALAQQISPAPTATAAHPLVPTRAIAARV